MRFWLWLTTGMVTKQWVAIHRKHHRFSDADGDPHSPHVYGIKRVFFKGAGLYHEASKDKVMVDTYGVGTPADWMELQLALGVLLSVAKSCITTTTWNQRVPASLKSGGSLT